MSKKQKNSLALFYQRVNMDLIFKLKTFFLLEVKSIKFRLGWVKYDLVIIIQSDLFARLLVY